MWLYCGILIHLFGFLLARSFDDAERHTSPLERKLTLKLKTAARLKHNLGKILHELPIQSYEMHHSIKIIEDYLKNGGSLLECLDVLPSVTYAPIVEQIDSIFGSMEDRLPKYLLPAVSLIRRSLSEGLLDANEIYRPTFGPLKADPLEKIPLRELKEAASPLTYRAPVKSIKGPWPKIVGETATLIHDENIPPRSEMIAYMLANLRIPDATAEVRESIVLLVEYLRSHGKHKLTGFSLSSDPYALVANAVSSLSLQNDTLIAANVLLPFLRRPSECRGSAEFANFFQNDTLNYTLLISRDRTVSRSRDGIAFLAMIQQKSTDVSDIIERFSPFEYASWKDLLLAFVGQLRRLQPHQGKLSNVVDSVYGELILRNNRKRWQLLRNSIIAAPVLSAIARRENSLRTRRLLLDVAADRTIKPEVWREALAFSSSEDISGPINAALNTLKALLASGLLPNGVLSMNIAELITIFETRLDRGQADCSSQLETHLVNFTQVEMETDEKKAIEDVDVKDLLQALSGLDIYTDEYKNLKSFLSQNGLETKIGRVDLIAHPTRGRLLAQLLQMIERADSVDNNLRRLAEQLVDNVVYEGYGSGALSYRSN
ncbi:PREDICTED: uncharacterized protein LOC105561707 [Vollenhovia emeryi]|uniref:uncharacterized protein LOC105561707 n=1 Tax=Vollenhovia emeryi TaxID=411798 RepID=UPI0005F541AF|nr:PREDICTED: uncharacterized protein LOC105561707 [Vollenhovia emeryi]